eukprot:m.63951 g.63951  ORF g.63951 m.63951 type:complete len:1091 (+) comp8095_c0_seq1:189-3461(+)
MEMDSGAMLTPGDLEEQVNSLHYAAAMGDKRGLVAALQSFDVNLVDVFGRTALVYAVVADRMNCAEILIKAEVDVNGIDNEGRSALHWACFHDRPRMVKLLLACGADPHIKDNDTRTCLHHACTSKSQKCFSLIHLALQDPDFLRAIDQWGMTCVHWACQAGATDILKYILGKLRLPFLIADFGGKIPLHWACSCDNPKAVQYVVGLLKTQKLYTETGATVPINAVNSQDDEGRTPLHIAVGSGQHKNVVAVAGISHLMYDLQDSEGRTPLHWAAHNPDKAYATTLIQKGGPSQFFKFDHQGVSALHYAVHEGNVDTAVAILSHKDIVDTPDQSGRTAFMVAAIKGDIAMAKKLVAAGKVDPQARDVEGNSALHIASYFGFDEFTSYLIELGCSADDYDDRNISALFHATEAGHTHCVRILAQNGANLQFRDADGRTLLHWAAISTHHEILEILLSGEGINVDSTDRELRTPLHNSVFVESLASTEVLLKHGANPNEQDNMGIAALHWAVSKDNMDMCRLLVEHGADPSITEFHEDRYTPVDYAIKANNKGIEAFLRQHGGKPVDELKEESAKYLQAWWMGHRARISLLGLLQAHLREKVLAKEDIVPTNKLGGRRPTKSFAKAGFDFEKKPPHFIEGVDDVGMNDVTVPHHMMNRKASMALPQLSNLKRKEKKSPKKVVNAVVSLPNISGKPSPVPHREKKKIASSNIDVDGSIFQSPTQQRVKGERNRVAGIRQKIDAARIIQRAVRRWLNRPHDSPTIGKVAPKPRNPKRKQPYEGIIRISVDPRNKEQQVAALTIQLAWRQYLTEKTKEDAGRNGPRHRSDQQAAVYLSEVPIFQWKPTLSPTVRPIEFRSIPSAANTSYHMALSTYTKPFADLQKQRFQKAQSVLMQREEEAQHRLLETEHKLRSLASLAHRPANYDMSSPMDASFNPNSTQVLKRGNTNNDNDSSLLPPEKVENYYSQYDSDEEKDYDYKNDTSNNGFNNLSYDMDRHAEHGYGDEEDFSRFKAQLQQQQQQDKQDSDQRSKVDPYSIIKNYQAQKEKDDFSTNNNSNNGNPFAKQQSKMRHYPPSPPKRKAHAGMKLPSLSTV